MSADKETLAVYDAQAGDYARLVETNTQHHSLREFIAMMPDGGAVLDVGCGPGAASGAMAAEGLRVEAFDASAEMVALAAAHEGVTARQGVFEDVDAVDTYDGVWVNFSLLHAPRADMAGHLKRFARALKANGVLHLGLKEGTGAARDSLGRFYTYYKEDELRGLVEAAGLTVMTVSRGSGKGLDGAVSPWIILRAKRT